MERYRLNSRRTRAARLRLLRLAAVFSLLVLLVPANAWAAGSGAPPEPPAPPSEKALCQYGQWETEYWDTGGMLSFSYVGDQTAAARPEAMQGKRPDFVITAPTLLTAIVDVHLNPYFGQGEEAVVKDSRASGGLALVDQVGNMYGPFAIEGPAKGLMTLTDRKALTLLWVASVGLVELPPGHYWVVDSDPDTLVSNGQTRNVGATFVKGIDAAAYAAYMDALAAAEEEIVATPAASSGGGSGSTLDKATYNKPAVLVNRLPEAAASPEKLPSNPSVPAQFVTDQPAIVAKIQSYHLNAGKGQTPGSLALRDDQGNLFGPWQAYGQSYEGIPNAIWTVMPYYELPAGNYTVVDSDISTQSASADGRALCVVKANTQSVFSQDNVTGKYVIGFEGDDGTPAEGALTLTIIDHKKSLGMGFILDKYPVNFDAAVTERGSGVVKAQSTIPLPPYKLTVLFTFGRKSSTYVLSGHINITGPDTSGEGINFSGVRVSVDLPGFVPKPAAGVGKLGNIPGPGSAAQAVAGIAIPTLAMVIVGIAAGLGSGGGGGGSGDGGGDSGGDDSGSDGDVSGDGGGGEFSGGGGAAGDGGGSGNGGTGQPGAVSSDAGGPAGGSPDQGSPSAAAVLPSPVEVPPPLAGPQEGQTMTVFDAGDRKDKTYVYHADTGEWINPISGGPYVPYKHAAAAQAAAETGDEAIRRAATDAAAAAEGPTKWLAQSQADGRAKLKMLADIQNTRRFMYTIPGAEGEGPISSADRLGKMEAGLTDGTQSIDDTRAALNRQKQFINDMRLGELGTQGAADLAASQDSFVAASAHATYNVVGDVEGKTWSGVAFRGVAGAVTGGASEAIYIPANIAIKTSANMDEGSSLTGAFAKAAISEGATQAAMAVTLHSGGAAIKGAANALGIKPSVTLPDSWVKTLATDVLPGSGGKAAAQAAKAGRRAVDAAAAQVAEDLAAHNATFRAINQNNRRLISQLDETAANGALVPDSLKPILRDTQAKRALEQGGPAPLKQAYNETLETSVNKPAYDHANQALVEKYGTLTDPAHPGYKYKQMLDEGATLETTSVRTPTKGVNTSVNADNDVAGFLVQRDAQGNVINRVELPAHDVGVAHSEGFGQALGVYNAETRTFNAAQASAELRIDFTNPKALTQGMSHDELARFGLTEDLSNLTPNKLRQLQLSRYAKGYGQEVPGVMGVEGARDYSAASTSMMRDGQSVNTPAASSMKILDGQGGLLDPQGLALMEQHKVANNWANAAQAPSLEEAVRLKMEAMESLRKMAEAEAKVSAGYAARGVEPLPANLQAAVDIAKNRSIAPDVRALRIQALGVGDPVTLANKISARIEAVKMAAPKN